MATRRFLVAANWKLNPTTKVRGKGDERQGEGDEDAGGEGGQGGRERQRRKKRGGFGRWKGGHPSGSEGDLRGSARERWGGGDGRKRAGGKVVVWEERKTGEGTGLERGGEGAHWGGGTA